MSESKITLEADSLQLDTIESAAVKAALEACGANMKRTARMLGIDRRTLYRKCEKYKIDYAGMRSVEVKSPEPSHLEFGQLVEFEPPATFAPTPREPSTFSNRDEPGQGGTGMDGYW